MTCRPSTKSSGMIDDAFALELFGDVGGAALHGHDLVLPERPGRLELHFPEEQRAAGHKGQNHDEG